jgi:hypothetical protein
VIRTPASNNQLLDQLARGRGTNPAMWGGGTTLYNRVPGEPLFLVDPNNHLDPTQQLVLNPKAWSDAAPGTFGTSAPYYNDYRWRRQPSEALSLGRNFPIHERATLHIRIEFQNVFNRLFLANPLPINPGGFPNTGNTPDSPTTRFSAGPNAGQLSGGYGYVNTIGGGAASPRSGQIVARITL